MEAGKVRCAESFLSLQIRKTLCRRQTVVVEGVCAPYPLYFVYYSFEFVQSVLASRIGYSKYVLFFGAGPI